MYSSMEKNLIELLDGKKINIGIYGCCISRAIFNSSINNHYKEFFNLSLDAQRSSYISLVQPPIDYNKDDLAMPIKDKSSDFNSYCLAQDLSKKFFEDLKTANLEYLLIDLHWEVDMGILKATLNNEDIIITNNAHYYQTKFNEFLRNKEILDIKVDTDEYFQIWKDACDELFGRISSSCPNLKILVVPVKHVYVYKGNDGLEVDCDDKENCDKANLLIGKLEDYMVDNYGVVKLKQPEAIGDPNHIFGKNKVHYTKDFYNSIYNQILSVCYDDMIDDFSEDTLRKQVLYFKRENEMCEAREKALEKTIEDKDKVISENNNEINLLNSKTNSLNNEMNSLNNNLSHASIELNRKKRDFTNITNSLSFRIGRVITYLPRKIRDLVK